MKNQFPNRFEVTYRPRGSRRHYHTTIGLRQLELLHILSKGWVSRLEMVEDDTRAALNAPSIISALNRKGITIDKQRKTGVDRDGRDCWWTAYRLGVDLLRVEQVKKAPRAGGARKS